MAKSRAQPPMAATMTYMQKLRARRGPATGFIPPAMTGIYLVPRLEVKDCGGGMCSFSMGQYLYEEGFAG